MQTAMAKRNARKNARRKSSRPLPGGSREAAPGPAPAVPRPARTIGLWKKLLFATISVGLFYGVLEFTLWLAGVRPLITREDPSRGFSGIVTVFERAGDVYRTRRAAAQQSFNEQSFLAEKPADGLRIFCLGGSSAYGFPWGAEAAFTSVLGELLAARHPELHVEAINAAGVSYGMHRLNIVADELRRYQPDIFIIYSGHNEFIEPAFFESLKNRSAIHTQLEYQLAHSRVYSAMRSALEYVARQQRAADSAVEVDVRRDETRVFAPEEKAAIVAEYRWRLERLVRRAQEAQIKVVLVTVPANLSQWRPQASAGLTALAAADRELWSAAVAGGQREFRAGNFAAAAGYLEQAARLAPDHAETQYYLGRVCEQLGRFDEARAAYQRACDTDASPIRRVSGINEAIRDVARQRGALLVDADQIFEQQSEHGLVGFNLIEDYVHPTRAGHELLGWCLWDAIEREGWLGHTATADRALFEQVLAQRRSRPMKPNAVWLFNQGVVLQNQGRAEAAIERYREALAIVPAYRAALHNLGGLLCDTGQTAEAVEVLERLVEIDPQGGEAHYNLATALHRLGRLEEAITHYREALRLRPSHAGAHNNWGMALFTRGQYDEAAAHYEAAVQLRPDDIIFRCNLANTLQKLGRLEEAVSQYQEVLRLQPHDIPGHRGLGDTLQQLGRADEAAAHHNEAARLEAARLEEARGGP